jgi:hypothetical protein
MKPWAIGAEPAMGSCFNLLLLIRCGFREALLLNGFDFLAQTVRAHRIQTIAGLLASLGAL